LENSEKDLKTFTDLSEILRLNPDALLYFNDDKWYVFKDEPEWDDDVDQMADNVKESLLARSADYENPMDDLIEALAFHAKITALDVDDNDVVSLIMDQELFNDLDVLDFDDSDNNHHTYKEMQEVKGAVDAKTVMVEKFIEGATIDKVRTQIIDVPKHTPPVTTLKTKVLISTESGVKKTVDRP